MSTETQNNAPVSAEPVAYYLCTHANGKMLGTEEKETADTLRDIGWIPEPLYRRLAPVAAPVKPYSLDLDPAGIRALTADAISGALALGFQGVSPPPNNEHWLAPFWENGRESAVQAQQPVSGADRLPVKGDPWSGWACQHPGKLPRLYGDKAIAELNHHPEEGDRLFQLAECIQQDADKVDVWQCTTTLQESDDLIWLYCQDTNTIDGPVKPNPEFIDAWTHWAWVTHPSTTAIDAARKDPDQ
ncbi:MAG: hypothetical protein ACTJHY_12610 [Alcaligenes pakistanensis]